MLISVAQKAIRGTSGLEFLFTQGTLQCSRVEDHRMMFTRQLQLPQFLIQEILYTYKIDYMMSLTPLHPSTGIHFLHTVLHTFGNVLARRICLTVKRFFG